MPRILVADDNTNIQKMVALAFEERGIDVASVGNGEAAVRRIPDLKPDLVLADVFMPVRNGYEVCEFVKKDGRFSHIPVILLVGAFDPLDEKEARRVGADGVLKKPFVPPDPLIAMVTSALEKNPKLAAELSKAKETAPEPPRAPALEIPAKPKPAPLPDFPEPSPEEAASIYGYGTGRRDLDKDEKDAGHFEEPKAPVAEVHAEDEEEFDGASTTRDWRRTADSDFEVPENTAANPAYTYGQNLEPITFPSEQDVPPKHIRRRDIDEQEETVAPNSAQSDAGNSAIVAAPEPARPAEQAATEFTEVPASEVPADPAPSPASRAAGWMDMMAPPPSEYPESGWMADAPASCEEAKSDVASALSQSHQEELPIAGRPSSSESWFAPPPPLQETLRQAPDEAAAEPRGSGVSDLGHELVVAPADAMPLRKEPNLVEDTAVRVIPEPLLENEDPEGPSKYGTPAEEISPLYTFLPPPEEVHTTDTSAAEIISEHAEPEPLSPEPAPVESASEEFTERTPTELPPSREALSDIPFLAPPSASPSENVDSATVDTVVKRVLEKLEPQLHDLLSKGVLKPLVENLLQDELTKKAK